MNFRPLFTLLFVLLAMPGYAQLVEKEVLFTVADEPVYASEFIRVYRKNLDLVQDDSQKDVDEYLKLFTRYKLKLKEARNLGYDKKKSYLKELNSYEKQLAKNYMSDPQVTEDLVKEAYERSVYEVEADHILIRIEETATPEDTLKVYNDLLKLRERALKEGFDKVREEVHNGSTVFGEKLGYFGAFKMVYKFESMAYNTHVGEISMPFRTRFGYHIVKVIDKRKSDGKVEVAHIMIAERENDSLSEKLEDKIQDIYMKLEQGESFEELAKQFSTDRNTSQNGGKLAAFGRSDIDAKPFVDKAFSLDSIGEFSKPVRTNYGWHIIKLLGKKPVPDFKTLEPELVESVKKDSRSRLINEALIKKLVEKYEVDTHQPDLSYFESILDESYFTNSWKLPDNFKGNESLVMIGDRNIAYQDFADFLLRTMRTSRQKEPFEQLLTKKYQDFLGQEVIQYQEDHLENDNEEYAHLISEYRDGLLLFELMEETIWNETQSDSIEVQNYYENNKQNYVTPKRIDAIVATSSSKKNIKKVSKLLEQGLEVEKIKTLVNSNDKIEVIFTTGVLDASHQGLPENLVFQKGVSKIYKHNQSYVVVQVKEVMPSQQKTLDEAKGAVINDYQTYKEEKWMRDLANKYKVEVNETVLNKVKGELK
ncbi:peptidylprolyl isomerase [Cognatitamlana onchidii]|uniref:peptidylprolyl isomerase n=1 Tax=Cognatitamlana onchidii TaxID=2562860 RepID=UPI0010A63C24|nr:peptidylprolyl isomerase [Algibacter onchidii]